MEKDVLKSMPNFITCSICRDTLNEYTRSDSFRLQVCLLVLRRENQQFQALTKQLIGRTLIQSE